MNPSIPRAERIASPEVISLTNDVMFILPTYPFRQKDERSPSSLFEVEDLLGSPRNYHPSGLGIDTRLKVLAGVFLAGALAEESGSPQNIVTMTRSIRTWMDSPYTELMETEAMKWAEKLHIHPESLNIIREEVSETEGSYDLLTEIEVALQMSKDNNWEKIVFITDSEHGKRVQKILDSISESGEILPEVIILPMEDIINNENIVTQHQESLQAIISKLHNSPFWNFWTIREAIARQMIEVSSRIAKRTR